MTRILLVIGLAFCVHDIHAFDLPESDPWYYQSDDAIQFWVPDKAQHFYGSNVMTESGLHPMLVFSAGLIYELWQERQGVGFSKRDIIANTFGIMAGMLNHDKMIMMMDYSVLNKHLMLRLVVRL